MFTTLIYCPEDDCCYLVFVSGRCIISRFVIYPIKLFMMRHLIALLCLLGISLVCLFCAPARVQCFLVRGTYTGVQVDSIISVHTLPPLSSWRGSVQFTSNGGRVPQWFYVEQYRKSDTVELVHVVEQRGGLYQYVCRAVLRGRNSK